MKRIRQHNMFSGSHFVSVGKGRLLVVVVLVVVAAAVWVAGTVLIILK